VGFHCEGTVLPWDNAQKTWLPKENLFHPDRNFDDTGPYYDNPVDSNGYAQHWPDDELWAYPTRITARPYLSEIEAVFAKPFKEGGRANRFRVCFTNLMRGKDRKGQETIVLDRPNVSPDGTKMLYNSNVFGLVEVYMTEIRKPRPPVNVKAEWTGGGVKVSWEPPKYRAEIGGYLVYRSDESGRGFAPLTAEPVAAAEYVDRTAEAGRAHFYAVRSVERSRLESGLSAEAAAASDKKLIDSAPLRLFAEAEDAIPAGLDASPPDGLWLNVDGFASNLYYLWQRRSDRPGMVELDVDVPRAGSYWVLARLKGREGAAFQVAGSAVQCGASESWQWAKSAGQASLRAGRQKIQMASSKYGSCIDCLYLSTDGSFEPKGRISAVEPEAPKLTAQADAQGRVRLSWSGKKDARWLCWNLYCGGQAGLPCGRKTLFASHDAEEYLDWQAPAGAKYYRATQLTLDGIESKPSNEVEVK